MSRTIKRPKPHIISVLHGDGRQWLCQSVEVQPRGKPSRLIGRWDSTPSNAYRRWRLAWAEWLLRVFTEDR